MQLVAQMPNWYLPTSRKNHYPEKEWYTGFVEGAQKDNEVIEDAVQRLKIAARVELISTITTSIEHSSRSYLQSHLQQSTTYFEELLDEAYNANTTLQSRIADIHGLQVETYYNPENKEIAAFAYLNKSEVCQYYFSQHQIYNSKVMSQLSIVEYLISNDELFKALNELQKASEFLNYTDENFKRLFLFNCDNEQINTLLKQHLEQKQIIDKKLTALSHTTNIFMECEGEMFGMPCIALINNVKKQLSEQSCSFVSSPEQADWIVNTKITAELDESRDNSVYNFVTIDITGTIKNAKNNAVYNIHQSEYNAAPKANGDERLVVKIIIEQESLSKAVANDIIEILKSK